MKQAEVEVVPSSSLVEVEVKFEAGVEAEVWICRLDGVVGDGWMGRWIEE